jgi:hypothetical protein
MNPHLITVYLLIEANEHLQGQVAEALQGVLTDEMRTSAGTDSALIDGRSPATTSRHRSHRSRSSTTMRPTGRRFPSGQGGRSDVDHASASGSARTHGKDAS